MLVGLHRRADGGHGSSLYLLRQITMYGPQPQAILARGRGASGPFAREAPAVFWGIPQADGTRTGRIFVRILTYESRMAGKSTEFDNWSWEE